MSYGTNQDQRNMKYYEILWNGGFTWIFRFTMKKRRIELVKMGRQYCESNKNWGFTMFHHVSPDKVHVIPFHSHKIMYQQYQIWCIKIVKIQQSNMWLDWVVWRNFIFAKNVDTHKSTTIRFLASCLKSAMLWNHANCDSPVKTCISRSCLMILKRIL